MKRHTTYELAIALEWARAIFLLLLTGGEQVFAAYT
jgi:hypothetical protein